jgi:2-polyprenyl-6-methoxyphenol hydroxylase-like FAD-dependent oxidoreductase
MSRYITAPHFQDLKVKSNDSFSSVDRQPATDILNPSDATLRPPSALIIGGSIGGCCAAIALASIGTPVTILERTPGQLPSQGAGLVIQPDMAAFLLEFKVCTSISELSFKSSGKQYVDKQGHVICGDDQPQLFGAWDVLYRALRAAVPDTSYRAGCTVQSIKHVTTATSGIEGKTSNPITTNASKEKMSARTNKTTTTTIATTSYEITLKNSEEKLTTDILVGADGPGSLVRSHFLPNERSHYQGYVAWRGVLQENAASENTLSLLGQKFTVYQGENFHILCYLIPGSNGEIDTGKRRVNWVWYCNHSEDKLSEILTDVNGKSHGFSVPKGFLKPEIAENLKEKSRNMLPAALSEMVCSTTDIFVQAIHDYLAPKLVFHDSAVLLGDSGCILRPHTAAGTTKAAVNAWALADCLKLCGFYLAPALKRYNESMLELGRELVEVGVEIGTKSQFPE